MEPNQRFALNEPTVIQEIIDGEAIIADLSRGFYYSLDPIGSRVWDALVSGWSVSEIVDALSPHFACGRETIFQGTAALLDRLLAEELIVQLDSSAAPAEPPGELTPPGPELKFVPPVLSKYTDMEQLLLLDPIHDVDETGWPNEPGEAPGQASGGKSGN